MKTDFSSPFMEATIIKNPGANEKRFPLSVNSDQSNLQFLQAAALTGTTGGLKADDPLFSSTRSYLSSVTISMDLGGVPTIDVVLTPTLEDARKIIDSTLLEYPLNAIEVMVGYSTGEQGATKSQPFQGILQPPEVNFGTDVTITLKGVGTAGYYLAATAKTGTESRQTIQKHIEDLVSNIPEVTTNFKDWLLDDDSKKALQRVVPLATAGTSYLHLISQLARQAGCWVNTFDASDASDKKIGFRKLNLISQAAMMLQSPLTLLTLYDFGGEIGPSIADKGIYPILSVSVGDGLSGVFLSGWAKTLVQNKIDQATHESSSVSGGPADGTVAGGESAQTGVKNDSNDLSKILAPAADDSADEKTALDQLRGMTSLSNSVGLQIDIETLGLPNAFPGNMYEVRGISTKIDDFYVCTALKHSVSASGFTTSLTLIKNSQIMVQAIINKISPKVTNQNAPIPNAPGTESQLQIADVVSVEPVVERAA